MKFTLISLMLATAYFAIAYFTIANSASRYWSESVRTMYGIIFAMALIYGYDRRHTPSVAFSVLGFTLAYFVNASSFTLSLLLERLGLFDRSVSKTLAVIDTFKHHLAMFVAAVGYFIWKFLSVRTEKGDGSG